MNRLFYPMGAVGAVLVVIVAATNHKSTTNWILLGVGVLMLGVGAIGDIATHRRSKARSQ